MEVYPLPTPVKTLNNMSKHLTEDEREAREAQEDKLPSRPPKKPKQLKNDKAATAHWTRILKTMQGVDILDTLDSDILGIYCAKLARRDELQEEYLGRRADYAASHDLKDLKAMLDIEDAMRSIERDLLAYASRLGLTPESRARLARRLAEQSDGEADDDLFA
jgi:P27 family predicted phage terminase small subunit